MKRNERAQPRENVGKLENWKIPSRLNTVKATENQSLTAVH